MVRAVFAALAWLVLTGAALAQVPLDGYLIALSDCEANRKKDSDNPGGVRLDVLRAYAMIGKNAEPGTHYLIKVPGAPEAEDRWVAMRCGAYAPRDALVFADNGGSEPQTPPTPRVPRPAPKDGGGSGPPLDSVENQFVPSWQPGFCATRAGRNKQECKTQTPDRPDATQFSVHGLWPDDLDNKAIFPCYCNLASGPISCDQNSEDVRSIDLPPDVLADLKVAMPGLQSGLELHEWTKHGTCFEKFMSGPQAGATPAEFFGDAMALLKQLNASAVRDLFVAHLGGELRADDIKAAFDAAFGAGAGDRVVVRCDRDTGVITELWISLGGEITATSDLGALIRAAPPTSKSTNARSCNGRVVKVGG